MEIPDYSKREDEEMAISALISSAIFAIMDEKDVSFKEIRRLAEKLQPQ
jgi:hypothetical protein